MLLEPILIDSCSSYNGTTHIRIVKDSGQVIICCILTFHCVGITFVIRLVNSPNFVQGLFTSYLTGPFQRYKTRYFWVTETVGS